MSPVILKLEKILLFFFFSRLLKRDSLVCLHDEKQTTGQRPSSCQVYPNVFWKVWWRGALDWLVFQSPDTQAWQNDYLQGTGCEMYTETLSPSFTGMTFPQASE